MNDAHAAGALLPLLEKLSSDYERRRKQEQILDIDCATVQVLGNWTGNTSVCAGMLKNTNVPTMTQLGGHLSLS